VFSKHSLQHSLLGNSIYVGQVWLWVFCFSLLALLSGVAAAARGREISKLWNKMAAKFK